MAAAFPWPILCPPPEHPPCSIVRDPKTACLIIAMPHIWVLSRDEMFCDSCGTAGHQIGTAALRIVAKHKTIYFSGTIVCPACRPMVHPYRICDSVHAVDRGVWPVCMRAKDIVLNNKDATTGSRHDVYYKHLKIESSVCALCCRKIADSQPPHTRLWTRGCVSIRVPACTKGPCYERYTQFWKTEILALRAAIVFRRLSLSGKIYPVVGRPFPACYHCGDTRLATRSLCETCKGPIYCSIVCRMESDHICQSIPLASPVVID
jgi:hypothetical protein